MTNTGGLLHESMGFDSFIGTDVFVGTLFKQAPCKTKHGEAFTA